MEVSLSHDLPVAACISGFLAVLAAFEAFIFTVAMFFTPFIFRHSLVFAQLTTTVQVQYIVHVVVQACMLLYIKFECA